MPDNSKPGNLEVYDDLISFPDRAREGVTLFNNNEYWESHEAWEDIWQAGNPTERLFYQGLIQIAAGFVKIQKVWHAPAVLNLRKGLSKLEVLGNPDIPIDLPTFVNETQVVLEILKVLGRVRFEKTLWTRWPKISYLHNE